jgi:hypothetical protein
LCAMGKAGACVIAPPKKRVNYTLPSVMAYQRPVTRTLMLRRIGAGHHKSLAHQNAYVDTAH